MNITIAVILVHIPLTYLLTLTFGFGIYGPPIALVISDFIGFFATVMYIQYLTKKDEKLKAAWFWPSKACLQMSGFIEFMKFGVPSIGLVCLDWWSYEILILFAAGISVKSIAIQVLVLNNGNLFYMPHAAYMVSSEILIGTCIGAKNTAEGKHILRIFNYLACGTCVVLGVVLYAFSDILAAIYTNIPDLEVSLSSIFRFYAFYYQLDGLRSVMIGAMRGLGLLK